MQAHPSMHGRSTIGDEMKNKSTRALKRLYLRHLKGVWRYAAYRREGAIRYTGLSGDYWNHRERLNEIREILKIRGVEI